jgi:pimeloyl-ACP methyl ester carboxylesterase
MKEGHVGSRSRFARRVAAVVTGALLLAAAAVQPALAAAPVSFTRIAGYRSPGTPSLYNKVGILKTGSPKAKNILVLNPGTSASAAYFEPLAQDIVAKRRDWQVWAVERRENLLEDQSVLDKAKARTVTPQQAFDYYLGYLADPTITNHFQNIPNSSVTYAKQWGMKTEIQDLRKVVLAAKRLGGKVVVGGHSLGGSITTAYATWDFGGKAGADGLAGLVFIDGGSGPTPSYTEQQAKDALAKFDDAGTSPWLTFGGFPAPLAGLFNSTGSLGALLDPDSPSVGQKFSLLPADLKPPIPVTNVAQYGYALDVKTSPMSLIAAQAHLGTLAASGDPRGWDDSKALTPIKRFATMFSGYGLKSLDGTAWYHPQRLTMDAGAVAAGNPNPAQDVLDVDATKGKSLPKDLRIYAFGAALGGQRVLDAASALAKQSGISKKQLTLVNRAKTYAHNDPNSASPKNDFVKYLLPYLTKVAKDS